MNMQKYAKQSKLAGDAAITSGTWAKIGKSRYQRVTGEIVFKTPHGWESNVDKYVWPSRFAAFSNYNFQANKEAEKRTQIFKEALEKSLHKLGVPQHEGSDQT